MDTTVMANDAEKRRSERIVPIGSNEDVVVLHVGDEQHLAKILDLSDGGTCVYLVEPGAPVEQDDTMRMSLYHNQKIEDIEVKVSRKNGQVIGLEFQDLSGKAEEHVRAKIIRLEVEWMRLKPNVYPPPSTQQRNFDAETQRTPRFEGSLRGGVRSQSAPTEDLPPRVSVGSCPIDSGFLTVPDISGACGGRTPGSLSICNRDKSTGRTGRCCS